MLLFAQPIIEMNMEVQAVKKTIIFFLFFLCLPLSQGEAMSWGFKRSENHLPPSAGKQLDELLAKYDAFYLGDPDKKIYLFNVR
ncbi:MAG: hypothetical protein KatS3mg080_0566 [Anoxybacillus sp.]|nr:MAG: hypothetical protein KatS3mg080_0566 [Anoxybacillus sp.]